MGALSFAYQILLETSEVREIRKKTLLNYDMFFAFFKVQFNDFFFLLLHGPVSLCSMLAIGCPAEKKVNKRPMLESSPKSWSNCE